MSENQAYEGGLINSIIGVGTKFKGEFELSGVLRIDGDFTGSIRTKGRVFIGSTGRAECVMHAGNVVVGGIVRGDIYSNEMVTILSTGMVIGTITTPRLIIEDGVIFNGICRVSKDSVETAEETEKLRQAEMIAKSINQTNQENTIVLDSNAEILAQNLKLNTTIVSM
jgi:cytoskeletal protein CcmA (bactofilin family)